MQIDPDKFYPADARELEPLGAPQTRARHRHEGKGCPYFKIGPRVFYRGSDVLNHIQKGRVETSGGTSPGRSESVEQEPSE